ncbi:MAG: ABC transporter substrate-binding protein [Thiobacillus sp. 65-69]|nr:PhnD/SsuA/transferrin family substrate-binding protein [Thiobacillus sp.]ODU86949.1 MAG: ABC transporter substrate-binding protein [Thiobacillus sp. SCN 65-179]OJW36757.1 MAG: ABC transporter substrate-binding protein [Thiobacillus sp. 65-69]
MTDGIDTQRRALLAGAMGLAAFGLRPVRAAAQPVLFGTTPVFLDEQAQFLAAWQIWLEGYLGRPVRFVQRASYREITELLLANQLDIAWLCGYPYVRHKRNLHLVAVPSYQGAPLYRSYLITPSEDTRTRSFVELRDRVFAYSDPDSNSGWLVPQATIKQMGYAPGHFFRKSFFTWSHRRVIEACAAGLALGGAVDGYIWDTLARQHPELTGATRVAWRSDAYGFPPIVAAPGTSRARLGELRRALLGMESDAEGRRLLARLNLDGFVEGSPRLFDGIEQNWRFLEG